MGRSFSRLNARKAERQMIIWDCVYSLVASLRERPKKIFQASSNLRPGLLISSHGEERREEWMTLRNLGSRKKKIHRFPLVVPRSRRRAAISRDLCPFSNRFATFVRLPACLAGDEARFFTNLKPRLYREISYTSRSKNYFFMQRKSVI